MLLRMDRAVIRGEYAHVFGSHIDSAIMLLDQRVPDTSTPELHTGRQADAGQEAAAHGKIIPFQLKKAGADGGI
jgi:hypothetical protein